MEHATMELLLEQAQEAALSMELDKSVACNFAPSDACLTTLSVIITCKTASALRADAALPRGKLEHGMAARFDLPSVRRDIAAVLDTPKFGLANVGFRNSITLEFKDAGADKNKKSAKVFLPGAKIQVAGIRSYAEIAPVMDKLPRVICLLLDAPQDSIQPVDYKISFCQAVMNLNTGVKTRKLHDILVQSKDVDPSTISLSEHVHGRLSIKRPGVFTIMIFATGKVILTGFTQPKQMAEAYRHIVNLVDDHFEHVRDDVRQRVKPPSTGKRGRKRKCDTLESFLLM